MHFYLLPFRCRGYCRQVESALLYSYKTKIRLFGLHNINTIIGQIKLQKNNTTLLPKKHHIRDKRWWWQQHDVGGSMLYQENQKWSNLLG